MRVNDLNEQDRRKLLNRRNGALAEYERVMHSLALVPPLSPSESNEWKRAQSAMARAESAEAEYFEALPVVPVSVCPFCAKPTLRTFDRWGFDGPWWRSDASPQDPPDCPHWFALLGAVRLTGSERAPTEIYVGPDAPFVIPRLLAHPSAVAVVGQLEMENGCTVWPIAYFAERRPRPEDSTAGWRRTSFVYTTQFSISGWRIPTDPFDFNLMNWFQRNKVRWCEPGNTALGNELGTKNIPESPTMAVVGPAGIVRYAPPDGNAVWPIMAI